MTAPLLDRSGRARSEPRPWIVAGVLLGFTLWVGSWLWIGRSYNLDDALIHLRDAEVLAKTGLFSYDGETISYGSSSPLYVILLAGLHSLGSDSPRLAKVVSMASYSALLVWVVALAASPRRSSRWEQACRLLLLAALLGPMAVRWLTDGMETSLVLLAVVGFVWFVRGRKVPPGAIGTVLAAATLTLLRVDLALGIACTGLALALEDLAVPGRRPTEGHDGLRWGGARTAAGLAAGTALAFVVLWTYFGSVLPDPAVVKSGLRLSLFDAIASFGRTIAASLGLGGFVVAAWLISTQILVRTVGRSREIASLPVQSLPVVLVLLIAIRGQVLHGVRHVLWAFAFPIAWNLWTLRARGEAGSGRPYRSLGGVVTTALVVVVVAVWAVEAHIVAPILRTQGETFDTLLHADLSSLHDGIGSGFDIGFIGYFSKAEILDLSGLVNGSEVAAESFADRASWVASRQPNFLFVTRQQAASLAPFVPLDEYYVTRSVPFPTVLRDNLHYLAVRGSPASEAATGAPSLADLLMASDSSGIPPSDPRHKPVGEGGELPRDFGSSQPQRTAGTARKGSDLNRWLVQAIGSVSQQPEESRTNRAHQVQSDDLLEPHLSPGGDTHPPGIRHAATDPCAEGGPAGLLDPDRRPVDLGAPEKPLDELRIVLRLAQSDNSGVDLLREAQPGEPVEVARQDRVGVLGVLHEQDTRFGRRPEPRVGPQEQDVRVTVQGGVALCEQDRVDELERQGVGLPELARPGVASQVVREPKIGLAPPDNPHRTEASAQAVDVSRLQGTVVMDLETYALRATMANDAIQAGEGHLDLPVAQQCRDARPRLVGVRSGHRRAGLLIRSS